MRKQGVILQFVLSDRICIGSCTINQEYISENMTKESGSNVWDYKHIADSFDNAMKIGMEGLRNLSGEECYISRKDVN